MICIPQVKVHLDCAEQLMDTEGSFSAKISQVIDSHYQDEVLDPPAYEMATFNIIEEKFTSDSWFEVAKSYVTKNRCQLSLVTVDALAGKSQHKIWDYKWQDGDFDDLLKCVEV